MASVYDSSSITFFGRFIRFGGGGIICMSVERRDRALDFAAGINDILENVEYLLYHRRRGSWKSASSTTFGGYSQMKGSSNLS
jgi:hypothetical protein